MWGQGWIQLGLCIVMAHVGTWSFQIPGSWMTRDIDWTWSKLAQWTVVPFWRMFFFHQESNSDLKIHPQKDSIWRIWLNFYWLWPSCLHGTPLMAKLYSQNDRLGCLFPSRVQERRAWDHCNLPASSSLRAIHWAQHITHLTTGNMCWKQFRKPSKHDYVFALHSARRPRIAKGDYDWSACFDEVFCRGLHGNKTNSVPVEVQH